ncbi:MAG: hypothetical protein R2794_12625 [Chitinophagales bacterium]
MVCYLPWQGEGGVGPNLTDGLLDPHGGSINNVFHTIYFGVPEKSMAAWGENGSAFTQTNI